MISSPHVILQSMDVRIPPPACLLHVSFQVSNSFVYQLLFGCWVISFSAGKHLIAPTLQKINIKCIYCFRIIFLFLLINVTVDQNKQGGGDVTLSRRKQENTKFQSTKHRKFSIEWSRFHHFHPQTEKLEPPCIA